MANEQKTTKTRELAGADQRTPSVPQYFSWINNTNEGATEEQTHINLDFFDYLRRTYGMQIKIYAWDAGNFDGAGNGYGDADGEKFRTQYPNGYAPIAEHAASIGIRLGLWGGPDGFGDTEESEKKRFDFYADLCRKYYFAQFKLDGVCGVLRPEKASVFAKLLRECRKYSPDLIVLNHRLDLYEAEPHVTTFLWQGLETYVDVQSFNHNTGMHHRCFIFDRGLPDGLERLAEDHGVCISSCPDYFDDDIVYQAFGRCMILAPELYGNPWFLRDNEYERLARLFNLHRDAAPILVDGLRLPSSYGVTVGGVPGAYPISRGSDTHRFLVTGNNTWEEHTVTLTLNEEIGLHVPAGTRVRLISRHPYEELLGEYTAGERVPVTLMPFRAHLFEIAVPEEAFAVTPDTTPRQNPPRFLGTMQQTSVDPANAEILREAAMFGIDNDSLEARACRRSGPTIIPEVQAARDAFFAQKTYRLRGCEGAFAFDGDPDTFFDGLSRTDHGGTRKNGGCLRLDLGQIYDADTVEIECFSINEPIAEVPMQIIPETAEYSADLAAWSTTAKAEVATIDPHAVMQVVRASIHTLLDATGKRIAVRYPVSALRYFRLPCPMDRIYAIRLYKDGTEIIPAAPHVNNLQSPPEAAKVILHKSLTLTLPENLSAKQYLAIAADGFAGNEALWCAAECDGDLLAFPDRAPSYRVNLWESPVTQRPDENYTFYLPLDETFSGKQITLHALFCACENPNKREMADCKVYLCEAQ